MSDPSCTNQAVVFRNTLEEWLYAVEKVKQMTALPNFTMDGLPKEADWVDRMMAVRGDLVQSQADFIQELDAFIECVPKG